MVNTISGIWNVINSRVFSYVLIIVLAVLYLRGCGALERAEIESDRQLGNYLALQDTIRIISNDKKGILFEKSVLVKTQAELKEENADLVDELAFEKGKPPKVIIRTVITYRDTGIIVNSGNTFNSEQSSGILLFNYKPELPGRNEFDLKGEVDYALDVTDSINPVSFGQYNLDISQTIDIRTGLYRNPEDKRTYIRLFTDYPNLVLTDMQAIDITDAESKKALRAARKEFGIGFSVGYGTAGPYIGIGLNYSPKFLQFGK